MTEDELRAWISKERPRLERGLARQQEMLDSSNNEVRMGAKAFSTKYERELAILAFAERALTPWNTDLAAAPDDTEVEVLMPKVWCRLDAAHDEDDRTEHIAYVRPTIAYRQGTHWHVPSIEGDPSGEWLGEDVEWADLPLAWRSIPTVPAEIAARISKTNPTLGAE